MTGPKNVLVLMSDEHSRKILGCNGNGVVKTPNLDALAARGVNFRNAYCNSPVCVPARAVFATGQYLNRMGYWDNADPYDGEVTSWHRRLREAGHQVVSIGKVLHALEDTGLSQNTRVIYTSDHGDNLGARGLWGKSTLYEESAGVPAIMAGPGVPKGKVVETPVTHVDFYQTILQTAGIELNESEKKLPGTALDVIAEAQDSPRIAFCEYHGMGSTTGAFMVSDARYKYVFYVDYSAQFFDLKNDPEELNDLGVDPDPANVELIEYYHSCLEEICDPYAINARAKSRQAQQLDANGGREKVIERGDLGFSTPPRVSADFS